MTGEEWKPVDMDEATNIAIGKIRPFCTDAIDENLLDTEMAATAESIKNRIHQSYVPAGLKYTLAERAAGEYLYLQSGGDVQSVRLGDTQVSYSGGGAIESMRKAGESDLQRYRKLCF